MCDILPLSKRTITNGHNIMTRINTVKPEHLTNEWLLSEWRELPRIVNELEKHPQRFKLEDIPPQFKLDTGHVKFFRNKLLFLAKRHRELKRELRKRGIKHDKKIRVELHYLAPHIKMFGCNDWEASQRDHSILIERLEERFDLRKKAYHKTVRGIKQVINCEYTFNDYLKENLASYM